MFPRDKTVTGLRMGEPRDRTLASRLTSYLPITFFLCALIFSLSSLFKGFGGSIADMNEFRQTQTAITVRYLLEGGPWLAYETPVLGPPWSIPFEFPLYQWAVALTAYTGLFPFEQAGRIVSIVLFMSTFYPFYKILRSFSLTAATAYTVLGLYCLSPQYLFWSRTFMIESTALALSMYYFWFISVWRLERKPRGKELYMLSGIAVTASLAAAVKITTFLPFWTAGLVLFFWRWLAPSPDKGSWRARILSSTGFVAAAFFVPLTALFVWTSFSDGLKSLSPLGQELTSSALKGWNFGTLSQRLDSRTWISFFSRTTTDIIGNRWLLVIGVLSAFFCRKERRTLAILLLILFMLPLLIFTNLYLVHNYYAYANGVFLIAAAGIICSDLLQSGSHLRRAAGGLLLCSLVFFSVYHYRTSFYPLQGAPFNLGFIKEDMDRMTDQNDIIVVFGNDWSPVLPYHLKRRGVVFASNDITLTSFQKTKEALRNYHVGAVIFFGTSHFSDEFIRNVLSEFGFGSAYVHDFIVMSIYYNPDRWRGFY